MKKLFSLLFSIILMLTCLSVKTINAQDKAVSVELFVDTSIADIHKDFDSIDEALSWISEHKTDKDYVGVGVWLYKDNSQAIELSFDDMRLDVWVHTDYTGDITLSSSHITFSTCDSIYNKIGSFKGTLNIKDNSLVYLYYSNISEFNPKEINLGNDSCLGFDSGVVGNDIAKRINVGDGYELICDDDNYATEYASLEKGFSNYFNLTEINDINEFKELYSYYNDRYFDEYKWMRFVDIAKANINSIEDGAYIGFVGNYNNYYVVLKKDGDKFDPSFYMTKQDIESLIQNNKVYMINRVPVTALMFNNDSYEKNPFNSIKDALEWIDENHSKYSYACICLYDDIDEDINLNYEDLIISLYILDESKYTGTLSTTSPLFTLSTYTDYMRCGSFEGVLNTGDKSVIDILYDEETEFSPSVINLGNDSIISFNSDSISNSLLNKIKVNSGYKLVCDECENIGYGSLKENYENEYDLVKLTSVDNIKVLGDFKLTEYYGANYNYVKLVGIAKANDYEDGTYIGFVKYDGNYALAKKNGNTYETNILTSDEVKQLLDNGNTVLMVQEKDIITPDTSVKY